MKTMKRGDDIVRIRETQVEAYLQQGYQFCPKSEWKELRDAENQPG